MRMLDNVLRRLTPFQAIALSSMCVISAATALGAAQKFLARAETYPDFIVGYITWGTLTKGQDIATLPVLALAIFIALWLFCKALARIEASATRQVEADLFVAHTFLWCIPAGIAMGTSILYPVADSTLLVVSFAGIFALASSVAFGSSANTADSGVRSLVLFCFALFALVPAEVALLVGRLGINLQFDGARAARIERWIFLVCVALGAIVAARESKTARRVWPWLLVLAQAGLLAFYATLYPARLVTVEGKLEVSGASWMLWAVIATLVCVGAGDLARRAYHYSRNHDTPPSALLSPFALFGFLLALKCGATTLPLLPSDDYHYGESLLGWWSLTEFGKLPYIDYFPPHGFVPDDVPGLVDRLLFRGTAADLPEANRVWLGLLSLAAYLAMYVRTRGHVLAFVSILLFGIISGNMSWLFMVPFICLMTGLGPDRKVHLWWAATSVVMIVAAPVQGLTLAIATFPAVLAFVWTRRTQWKEQRLPIAIALVVLALSLLTPLPQMLFGAIRYVVDNAAINQIAFGIPWQLSWGAAGKMSGPVFEAIRMSWLAAPLLALVVILLCYRDASNRILLVQVALPILLFMALFSSYALGRIDATAMSRGGILSNLAWAILIPLLLLPLLGVKGSAFTTLIISAMCGAIGLAGVSRSALDNAVAASVTLPAPLVDGAAAGMPQVGRVIADPTHWNHVLNLKNTLDSYLQPGENYLDLTNRNAHYFYAGKLPAMAVSAPYNMASLDEQLRAVGRLRANLPNIALLEAVNSIFDEVGLSLRNPLLFRLVMDSYEPELRNGLIVGLAKSDALSALQAQEGRRPVQRHSLPIKDLSDVNWDKGLLRSGAAIVGEDRALVERLAPGDVAIFPNGQRRIIRRVGGAALWFDGNAFRPEDIGATRTIDVEVGPSWRGNYTMELWDRAFAIADLQKLPIAWGRSRRSLGRRMTGIIAIDSAPRQLINMVAHEERLDVTGTDPQIAFDLSASKIAGKDAGLLSFDFSCPDKTAEPRVRVFWWGDDQEGPSEAASTRFVADAGPLIIPLDAFPRWITLKLVKGISIHLDNASACSSFGIRDIWLNQRNAIH
jgi:hypothetical protein